MTSARVADAAELLASHALTLLAFGLVLGILVVVAIVCAVRALVYLERPLRAAAGPVLGRLSRSLSYEPGAGTWRFLAPSGFLLLHLLLGLAATGFVLAFAEVAEEVFGGTLVVVFDRTFASALQQASTPRWQSVFWAVSWLGSAPILTIATAIVALTLFRERRPLLAAVWIAGQGGGALLNLALKAFFSRARPEGAELLVSGWSFPSGHAMGTFIFCGLGAYLLIRRTRSWTAAVLLAVGAVSWCVVMGFSRLYLAVHYASDVLAGLVAGAAWVAVCVSGAELVVRREAVR